MNWKKDFSYYLLVSLPLLLCIITCKWLSLLIKNARENAVFLILHKLKCLSTRGGNNWGPVKGQLWFYKQRSYNIIRMSVNIIRTLAWALTYIKNDHQTSLTLFSHLKHTNIFLVLTDGFNPAGYYPCKALFTKLFLCVFNWLKYTLLFNFY